MAKTKSYKKNLIERLNDPKESAAYLNAALAEDDPRVFPLALRDIIEAGNPSFFENNRKAVY